ncbi:hypothetical protein HYALB_00005929 [Hymenoscyphus albidus]|uniref:Phytoene desaturase n=1 Tax=Hymenoscyphus albidus TaxID=595503 RepID=A0A9N9PXC5_9HELO|nr:hypothetical protein HYALB_00005929 [Hymenoscyphus albidus]
MASNESGQKTALVVGAGVGGIAIAARLSKAGFRVTVLEKNNFTGGRCSLIHHEGHRFDQGPSLLLLPKLFEETFYDLGTSLSAEGVQLLKCEPNYNVWFADGERIQLSSDTAVMKREIEKVEDKDGFERYLSWLAEAHRHYEISVREVLHKNFPSIFNLLRPSFLMNVFQLHPFESIYSRASKYFFTDRLRRLFSFSTMYMGMSPFDAPGTYSLLQYTELAEGIWYPIGGFHAIIAALEKVCQRYNVQLRLSTPVSSLITSPDGKTVEGVVTSSGEKLTADITIINADLVWSYNNLFPAKTTLAATQSKASSLTKRAGSCSSISFYWSLSQKIPELQTHNIFLADEYRESFDAIFDRQNIPDEPSFYVNVPSRIDPTAAPEGKDSIVVLVPVGHLLNSSSRYTNGNGLPEELDWASLVEQVRASVIKTIEARTSCDSLTPLITNEIVNSPLNWESKFNLDKGSILGLSHSFFNVLAFRPKTKAKERNLYFVGASTHPGTGMGTDRLSIPWARGNGVINQKNEKKALDMVQTDYTLLSDLAIWALAFIVLAITVTYVNTGLIVRWNWDEKTGWRVGKFE